MKFPYMLLCATLLVVVYLMCALLFFIQLR